MVEPAHAAAHSRRVPHAARPSACHHPPGDQLSQAPRRAAVSGTRSIAAPPASTPRRPGGGGGGGRGRGAGPAPPPPPPAAQAQLTLQPLLDGGGVEVGLLLQGVVPPQELQRLAVSPHARVHCDDAVERQLLAAHACEADLRGQTGGRAGKPDGQRRRRVAAAACTCSQLLRRHLRLPPGERGYITPDVRQCSSQQTAAKSTLHAGCRPCPPPYRHAVLHQRHSGAAQRRCARGLQEQAESVVCGGAAWRCDRARPQACPR